MSLTTAPPRHGTFPAEVTTFVGRRREIVDIKRLISSSRLVTLTGVGGAGKTRLALRVAAEVRRGFPNGVWFTDLAALEDEALLAYTVSSTLGLHDQNAQWPASSLADYLEDRRLLLVLDNCDRLRDACAVLADTLLRKAPGLRVLTTSRQTLGVTGEHVFQVPPLTLPEAASNLPVHAVDAYEALSLFVERAQAVRPSFALTDETVGAAIAVCRRLDGIPLAIELAAARLSALSVPDLLERLEDRFQVLVGGSVSAPPRHQTLRMLVEWSWDLCSEQERTLWSRAAVFRSGFDLSAAEEICPNETVDRAQILHVLTALVQKSILTVHETGGHVRYRMLETLQQFGQAHLEHADQASEIRERHRAYYATLASNCFVDWFSERQRSWLDTLLLELSNIRVALDLSLESPPLVDSGLKLASDLWYFWLATGRTNEARQWLDRGLQSASSPTPARTRALEACAYMCFMQDDLATAKPMVAEARLAVAHEPDPRNAAWATQLEAMSALAEGDLPRAQALFEDALAAHQANQDLVGAVDTSTLLAAVDVLLGDLSAAEELSLQAIATCDSHGEQWLKAYQVWDLGLAAWRRGDTEAAIARTQEALRLGRLLDEPIAIALCLELLAWNTQAPEQAARLIGGAQGALQRIGWQRIGVPVFGLAGLTTYHDQCLARLHDDLGPAKLELTLHAGAAMAVEAAVAAALGESPDANESRPRGERPALPTLTRRENEVAELVAQGLSNKAIAAKLVISQRTAEAHVERTLTKLGFTSRAQIAAWVVAQKLS